MNQVYEFSLVPRDIEDIANIYEEYKLISYLRFNRFITQSDTFYSETALGMLQKTARLSYEWGFNQISIVIYRYLYEHEPDLRMKKEYFSNIGTAYRDLTNYEEAIKYYLETREFFRDLGDLYRYFIEVKNLAFCYQKMGKHEIADRLLTPFEANFTQFLPYDLTRVYSNLAIRYRLMYDFQKEWSYLNKLIETGTIFQRPDLALRAEELRNYDLSNSEIINNLVLIEQKRISKQVYARFRFHQNHFNPKIAQIYLNDAFKEIPKEIVLYWVNKGINEIFLNDWVNLEITTKIIRNSRPDLAPGNYFFILLGLHQGNFKQCIDGLLLIYTLSSSPAVDIQEKTYNFTGNLIQKYPPSTLHSLVDEFRKILQTLGNTPDLIKPKYLEIMHNMANILIVNEVSEANYLLETLKLEDPSEVTFLQLGDFEMMNEQYNIAANYYQHALKCQPNAWNIVKKYVDACLGSLEYAQALEILERYKPLSDEEKTQHQKLRNYIFELRDKQIQFNLIPFSDNRSVFETTQILYNLSFEPHIDFAFLLGELSKGVELLIYHTLGPILLENTRIKYPILPDKIRFGNKADIKPLHPNYRLFLEDPDHRSPTLGNWDFLFKICSGEKKAENPLMELHRDVLLNTGILPQAIFDKYKQLNGLLLDPRNKGIHKDLVGQQIVTALFHNVIPLINDLIDFWYKK